jgi:hypothetical protein
MQQLWPSRKLDPGLMMTHSQRAQVYLVLDFSFLALHSRIWSLVSAAAGIGRETAAREI